MISQQQHNRPARIIRRVLHPTRFAPLDAPVFRVACALAAGTDTELIVAHIAGAKQLYGRSDYRAQIESRLEALRSSGPGLFVSTVIASGPVASEIAGLARDLSCDLIVMRESAPGWVAGRWTESLSQRVKRMAVCPVVCVSGALGHEVEHYEHDPDLSARLRIRNAQGEYTDDRLSKCEPPSIQQN